MHRFTQLFESDTQEFLCSREENIFNSLYIIHFQNEYEKSFRCFYGVFYTGVRNAFLTAFTSMAAILSIHRNWSQVSARLFVKRGPKRTPINTQ